MIDFLFPLNYTIRDKIASLYFMIGATELNPELYLTFTVNESDYLMVVKSRLNIGDRTIIKSKVDIPYDNTTTQLKLKYLHHTSQVTLYGNQDTVVKFATVSCNDNLKTVPCWNHYHRQDVNKWPDIHKNKPNVIIHIGDQVYADDIWNEFVAKKITCDDVFTRMFDLYYQTYTEPAQREAMSSAWNIGIYDDHEFGDAFGNPSFVPRCELTDKYLNTVMYLLKTISIVNIVGKDNSSVHYFGRYKIIIADTRMNLYYKNTRFSPSMIQFIISSMSSSLYNILVLPQPLQYLTQFESRVLSAVYTECNDDSLAPCNSSGTKRLKHQLFELLADKYKIKIISGDIHQTFIQYHRKDRLCLEEMVTSGVTRRTVEKESSGLKLSAGITKLCNAVFGLDRKRYSGKNNYGIINNYTMVNYY